jgi:hypothetical protein
VTCPMFCTSPTERVYLAAGMVVWPTHQYLASPAYEIQEAGEDGVQAERSEFIVRAWTPYAVRP